MFFEKCNYFMAHITCISLWYQYKWKSVYLYDASSQWDTDGFKTVYCGLV